MVIPMAGRFVQPDIVTSHFHLRDGDKVADFGAGGGYFIKALSAGVGDEGRVYACEIQKFLVDALGVQSREKGLMNVEPIWSDLEKMGGTKLADGILDVGILINTLFQIDDKKVALEEIARTIRPGGKFFVIDWSESFSGMGPQPGHVIDEVTTKGLVEASGFNFERNFPTGDHHYGLAFRRV